MKHIRQKTLILFVLTGIMLCPIKTESVKGKRYRQNTTPTVTTYWLHDNEKTFSRYESFYKPESIFEVFDRNFFEDTMVPQAPITFRNDPTQSVNGKVLMEQAEEAVKELKQGKKKLTHFKLLKNKNYDMSDNTGLIVLKYNDYPFILKLFMETPESFITPQDKGLQHQGMYLISGGMNRYLSGLYRIKNMALIKEEMSKNEIWNDFVDFPRKWHWLPEDVDWFEVRGDNFTSEEPLYTQLPSAYGIIVDQIISDVRLGHIKKYYGRSIFKYCKDFNFRPDPNLKNFIVEKDTNKLVCIDTEYFAPLLGMDPNKMDNLEGYWDLHVYAASRFFKEAFLSVT
ncbi:hypothetical protein JW872_03280 [Candidatus Babeliales bacterium]|nr:hypothetical protein [Candidatus Babeliales bacterium]